MGFFKPKKKSVPYITSIGATTRDGMDDALNKSYIPKFLYKPPFGYPRLSNLPYFRYLAKTPYVDMCITTILAELCSIPWSIKPNPELPEDLFKDEEGELKPEVQEEIAEIKEIFLHPNENKHESFDKVYIKKPVRDIFEVGGGVLNKIFNKAGQLMQVVARDAITFTKNPDVHGMYGIRAELLLPTRILNESGMGEVFNPWVDITASQADKQGAYFQYGWVSGPIPVPFGTREIVWLEKDPRSDEIYPFSPMYILEDTLQMLIYMIESDKDYYNENNVPKGIIGFEGIADDQLESFKDQWNEHMRRKDDFGQWKKIAHKVPVVNRIPKFEKIEFSSSEMQVIEKQGWYSKMVWGALGCTATELGYTEDAKGTANQIVQSKVFKKKVINPLVEMMEYSYTNEIVSEYGYFEKKKNKKGKEIMITKYVFDFNTFDIDEEQNKADLYTKQTENGLRTINEVRKEEGLDPVDWGDDPPSKWKAAESNSNFNFNGAPGTEEKPFNEREQDAQNTEIPDRLGNSMSPEPKKKSKIGVKAKYKKRWRGSDGEWQYEYENGAAKPKTGPVEKPEKPGKISSSAKEKPLSYAREALQSGMSNKEVVDGMVSAGHDKANAERIVSLQKESISRMGKLKKEQGERGDKKLVDVAFSEGERKVLNEVNAADDFGLAQLAASQNVQVAKWALLEQVRRKKVEKKALTLENPLLLQEGERPTSPARLEKAINKILKENEQRIKGLIAVENRQSQLAQIKAMEDLVKEVKNLLSFQGLKQITNEIIKNNFHKGWDQAEQALDKNFVPNPAALKFIEDYTFDMVKGMTDDVAKSLSGELQRGFMNGEGTTALQKRVEKVFDVGENRAEMIARTETNRAENTGKLLAYKTAGVEGKKKWITHWDDRTSGICKRLDKQEVGLDENFKDPVSGWEGQNPPSHIQCRSSFSFIPN